MRGAWLIFRRETAHYWSSPFAYLIAAAVLLLTGILFNRDLATSVGTQAANPALVPMILSFMMIFFAPLLTMRLLAEERREGTLELLLTAPVSDSSIVIGKFAGAWFYYTTLLLLTLVYQLILVSITQPDLGHTAAGYIGIWLYGGATLAVGLFFSSLTENQIVAAFLSMVALMILWLGDNVGSVVSSVEVARIVRSLTLQGHFSTSFAAGLVRGEDAVFFVGIIAVMLFATIRVVESNRWR